jgi:gamma-glutamylcyclotransferase (GGCT)/AIG2-like uncharacterized protein YtfP
MSQEYIFVYGTLKRDASNKISHRLANYAEFVGDATYRGKLYKIGSYPGVIPSYDPDDMVHGEVYLLHQANIALSFLDQYEEFGQEFPQPNEYIRQKQAVMLKNQNPISAWVYVYNRPTENLPLIKPANFVPQLALPL